MVDYAQNIYLQTILAAVVVLLLLLALIIMIVIIIIIITIKVIFKHLSLKVIGALQDHEGGG